MISKEELICEIEKAREKLNKSIDFDDSDTIYKRSVELDKLIEQYITAGY
ncbi:MAG TPA: aspartyl-phosphate phosphatase Spo0E family protein [Candidatus Hungatella pullicola]|nr:aspartyl-phosphate phosphatase Spo0E family protein [Candidatus Hungatella pullicola]